MNHKTTSSTISESLPWESIRSRGHIFNLPVVPLHEALFDEVSERKDMPNLLAKALSQYTIPPNYHSHKVVVDSRGSDDLVYPCALYIDGLPYSITDSVVGVWLVNLLTDRRHLIGVLRKRLVCHCGCKSWCTFSRYSDFSPGAWLHSLLASIHVLVMTIPFFVTQRRCEEIAEWTEVGVQSSNMEHSR